MISTTKRLGDYIQLVDNRNTDNSVDNVLGLNINKQFMPTVANVTETDLSKYKRIKNGQFVYSAMQVGRDKTVRVSMYTGNEIALVSPAYLTFKIIDVDELNSNYLMMMFLRPEFNRHGWFISDSTVRSSLEWDRFCDIELPIPDIATQRKYVAVYNALTKNQKSYEHSIDDLQLITDTYMDNLLKTTERTELGPYIKQVDNRNRDLAVANLKGISTSKKFITSKANTSGVTFEGYKVVNTGEFAYVADTSRRGDKIALAYNESKPCIISSIYTVFEIIDQQKLLPEFLLLWFKRSEFDRYARFNSWGSARETFDWSEMQRVQLPIPDIEVQKSIVAIHHVLESRKRINEKLKHTIADISPVLVRGVNNELEAVRV